MMLNKEIKTTQNYIDKYGMMMTKNHIWDPHGDNGLGDSIGRTVDAWFAYEDYSFIQAINGCYMNYFDDNGRYVQGYRHPSLMGIKYNDMSRDHIVNTLILFKKTERLDHLWHLSKYLRWKISDKYSFTIDLWLWMKGITGSSIAMFLYYLIQIPIMMFTVLWNKLIFILYRLPKEVPQDKFVLIPNHLKPKRIKKGSKLLYPVYTFYQLAFMMYVSPNSLGKWLLKRICLPAIDKENYLLRIMFGGKATKEQVDSYKPMSGYRWSTYLSVLSDRDQHILTDENSIMFNAIDKDLLTKMYYEKN